MKDAPQGVVAVLIGPDGRELANAADFGGGGPAGFTKQEAQAMRAKRGLALAAMHKLASPILSNAIDSYNAEKILDEMCRLGGCRILTVPIGQPTPTT